jgi:hypothetical protein
MYTAFLGRPMGEGERCWAMSSSGLCCDEHASALFSFVYNANLYIVG